jgi:protein O-GlcNAc transferase
MAKLLCWRAPLAVLFLLATVGCNKQEKSLTADELHDQAAIHIENGEWKAGLKLLKRAAVQAPNHAGIALAMCASSPAWGEDTTGWGAVCEKAIELDPSIPEPYYHSGWYEMTAMANPKAAIAHLRKAIELKPDYATAHDLLGAAYMKGEQFENAVRELELTVKLRPESGTTRSNLALALEKVGRCDDAKGVAAEAAKLGKDMKSVVDRLETCQNK